MGDTFYDAASLMPRPEVRIQRVLAPPEENASRWVRPATIRRAIEACNGIAAGVDFARVDLMLTRRSPKRPHGLVMGEVTLYPFGGKFSFLPRSVDSELAAEWCRG